MALLFEILEVVSSEMDKYTLWKTICAVFIELLISQKLMMELSGDVFLEQDLDDLVKIIYFSNIQDVQTGGTAHPVI